MKRQAKMKRQQQQYHLSFVRIFCLFFMLRSILHTHMHFMYVEWWIETSIQANVTPFKWTRFYLAVKILEFQCLYWPALSQLIGVQVIASIVVHARSCRTWELFFLLFRAVDFFVVSKTPCNKVVQNLVRHLHNSQTEISLRSSKGWTKRRNRHGKQQTKT